MMTTDKVAEIFDVNVATVRRWIREGRLDAVRTVEPGAPHGRFYVTGPGLRKLLEERAAARERPRSIRLNVNHEVYRELVQEWPRVFPEVPLPPHPKERLTLALRKLLEK